ncbi:MAG: Hint domain-containing protein [Pseudomonadota bacterium]
MNVDEGWDFAMADKLNGILISEILADNAGGGATDVNAVGGANKQDEFVELQNSTNQDISLSGYQIWSQENGLLHTFGATDSIPAGGTATVIGTYTGALDNPADPPNFFGANGNNDAAQGNGGFLEDGEGNKDDTIYLVAPDGNYIRLTYGTAPSGELPPAPATLPAGFPGGGTLQGEGEAINSSAPNGTAFIRDDNGDFVEGDPTPGEPGVPCFAKGTLITTEHGKVPVEDLMPGMRVLSRDRGYVTLRAMRAAEINRAVLRWNPELRPVRVLTGVLGNTRPMTLSPAHRVLVHGAYVELICGKTEAFVPVHHLLSQPGIERVPANRAVTYYHLLFDNHEVICSEGVWTESLYMGDLAHAAIRAVQDWEVAEGFDLAAVRHDRTARLVLKRYEAAVLLGYGLQRAKAVALAA